MNVQSRRFDSNADSNARERWRTLANDCELLTPVVNDKMNVGEPWRTLANADEVAYETSARRRADLKATFDRI